MQKINSLIPVLFLTSCYLPAALAEQSTPAADGAGTVVATADVATEGVAPVASDAASAADTAPPAADISATASQEQIVRVLQDDISFERKKRQLSNELALEKLRAELQKVRSESAPPAPAVPSAPPVLAAPESEERDEPVVHREPPSVLFISQVAGVSRVGVSVNGQLRFISRHEVFNANGKKYRLEMAKNNRLVAKETE